MKRIFALWAALAVFSPLLAQAREWKPPEGTVWQMPNGCRFDGNISVKLQGCYFRSHGAMKNTGAAFFRICGIVREPHPFVVFDFERNLYTLYREPEKGGRGLVEIGTLDRLRSQNPSADPEAFFNRLLRQDGSCEISA